MKELTKLIVEKVRTNSEIHYRVFRAYDVNKFYADLTKAKKLLDYDPQVSLPERIDLVIENFKKKSDISITKE